MIQVAQALGFNPQERFKLSQAEILANRVWNGSVLWGDLVQANLTQVAGLSNAQVIERLRSHDFSNLTVYLYEVPWFRRWSKEAAIEKPDGTIGLRRKFFSRDTAAGVTVRLCHECCHYAGFGHGRYPDTATDTSLPYTLERIVRRIVGVI